VSTLRKTSPLTSDDQLLTVLERARTVGFLGPGPLRVHLDHARAYGRHLPAGPIRLIDLGSGGGLPGIPLLADRTDITGVLLDAAQKRISFLVWALTELALTKRVSTITGRAEEWAHDADHRSRYDAVVCRGFGPPATTVECSAGYLALGGRLLISEPPGGRPWPAGPLMKLGLRHLTISDEIAVFEKVADVSDEYPRSSKRMTHSPLF